jgi:hypothetical protein
LAGVSKTVTKWAVKKVRLLIKYKIMNWQQQDNWSLYLQYQYLDDIWEWIEVQEYSEVTQDTLESIWEQQTNILNQIMIN